MVEEEQSRDMCRLEGIQFLITALLCLTLPWVDVGVGPWLINNGCIGKGRKLDTLNNCWTYSKESFCALQKRMR